MINYKPKICIRCGKEFIPNNNSQKYCRDCRIIVYREEVEQYALTHRGEIKQYNKQYRSTHREKMKEQKKQYYLKYRGEVKQKTKQWKLDNPEKVRKIGEKHTSKHRSLGFEPLNKPFEGADAHHIDKERVIYMPEEYHRAIRHCLKTGKGMALINALAWDYLIETKIREASNG